MHNTIIAEARLEVKVRGCSCIGDLLVPLHQVLSLHFLGDSNSMSSHFDTNGEQSMKLVHLGYIIQVFAKV